MTVTVPVDLELPGGAMLRAYDRRPAGGNTRLALVWHHGTPNVGWPPEPLFEVADRFGLRWVSYDRPGYGGSSRRPGRDLASAAEAAGHVTSALGIDRFAVVGHSGGGSHALACAAGLPHRVVGAVSIAALAPFDADGLDWFAGMIPSGVAALRAACEGREAKEAYEASGAQYDPEFTAADEAALAGEWAWLGSVAGPAMAGGPGGLVDDDIAYVNPWGCDPGAVTAPVLVVHGARDGIVPPAHADWLAARCPDSELWLRPDDGHLSVLRAAEAAVRWLLDREE